MNDLLDLWNEVNRHEKRLTYDSLAALMSQRYQQKYTGPNLGQLIKGTAKSSSLDTKNQIRTVLKEQLQSAESVVKGRSESAVSVVALRGGKAESELEIWKRRAKRTEGELADLRAALRALAKADSATPTLSEADEKERQTSTSAKIGAAKLQTAAEAADEASPP